MNTSPAEIVIQAFGGVNATARALDLTPSTVSKWQNHIKADGKGVIPRAHYKTIMKLSKEQGLKLTLNDLVFGRDK